MAQGVSRDFWNQIIWVSLSVAIATATAIAFVMPTAFPPDDGLFYIVIANNVAAGLGSTFNGISLTNGYHPLWLWVLSFVGALSGAGRSQLIYEAYLMQTTLFVISLFTIRSIYGRSLPRMAWAASMACAVFFGKGTFFLMETWLAFFFVVLSSKIFLTLIARDDASRDDTSIVLLFGLVTGMMVLARLDLIFFCVALWVLVFVSKLRLVQRPVSLGAVRPYFVGLLVTGSVLTGYLIFNRAEFGIFLPISGMIKSHFPHPMVDLPLSAKLFWIVLAAAPVLAAATCSAKRQTMHATSKVTSTDVDLSFVLLGLWMALAADLTYMTLFSHAAEWYFVEGWALIILGLPVALTRIAPRKQGLHLSLALVFLLLTPVGSLLRGMTNFSVKGYLLRPGSTLQWRVGRDDYTMVRSVADKLPDRAGLVTFDMPGFLASYSNLKVLPVDGLVNSFQYNADVVREGAGNYFCSRGLSYLLAPDVVPGVTYDRMSLRVTAHDDVVLVEVFSPIGNRSAGVLRLVPSDRVGQFDNVIAELVDKFPTVSLWKLSCAVT